MKGERLKKEREQESIKNGSIILSDSLSEREGSLDKPKGIQVSISPKHSPLPNQLLNGNQFIPFKKSEFMYKKFMMAKSVEYDNDKTTSTTTHLPVILKSMERTSSKGGDSIGTSATKAPIYSEFKFSNLPSLNEHSGPPPPKKKTDKKATRKSKANSPDGDMTSFEQDSFVKTP